MIEEDINKRWEQGIPHHPDSFKVYELLEESDLNYGGDYFCWKAGGDGDNGETLMYALDVYFEKNGSPFDEIEKLKASIQTCKKCGNKYYAQSHEYPCPYCTPRDEEYKSGREIDIRIPLGEEFPDSIRLHRGGFTTVIKVGEDISK